MLNGGAETGLRAMWRPLCRWLDLFVAWRVRRRLTGQRSHRTDPAALDHLLRELGGRPVDLLHPSPPPPSPDEFRVTARESLWGCDLQHFTLPSVWPTSRPENRIIWGERLVPPPETQSGAAILMLHPWVGPGAPLMFRKFGRPLLARGLTLWGCDLPHHIRRRPPDHFSGELAICGDLVAVAQTALQAVSDARRVILCAGQAGHARIGVLGYSLGGWLAATLAALEPSLAFAIAIVPPADTEQALQRSPLTAGGIRADLEASSLSREQIAAVCRLVSPLSHPARLAADRLLVVAAEHDALVEPQGSARLASHWGCALWREPHGHISLFHSGRLHRRLADWIAARLVG